MGIENSLLAQIQPILRHFDTDSLAGSKSFMYGKSISNQVQYDLTDKFIIILCFRESRHFGVSYESMRLISGFTFSRYESHSNVSCIRV